MIAPGTQKGRGLRSSLFGGVVGAAVGFGLSSVIYRLLNPVLEDSSGWVRELQGLLWNLVPLLTIAGASLGAWAVGTHSRRDGKRDS